MSYIYLVIMDDISYESTSVLGVFSKLKTAKEFQRWHRAKLVVKEKDRKAEYLENNPKSRHLYHPRNTYVYLQRWTLDEPFDDHLDTHEHSFDLKAHYWYSKAYATEIPNETHYAEINGRIVKYTHWNTRKSYKPNWPDLEYLGRGKFYSL